MAIILKRVGKNKEISYQCKIRISGQEIYKTFYTEKDANTYAMYKERLIKNMESFDIPMEERITFKSVFEMKCNSIDQSNVRGKRDVMSSYERIQSMIPDKTFIHQISYKDWEIVFKKISQMDVYVGGRNENCKRIISPKTIRNVFAFASSAYSFVISKGLNIENHPMRIMQTKINSII